MPITFRCPEGHKLSVSDTLAGRKARCPVCRQKMYVPADSSSPDQIARRAPEASGSPAPSAETEATLSVLVPAEVVEPPPVQLADDPTDVAMPALDAPAAPPPRPKANIYRPDPDKVQTARLLAVALALAALFTGGPVAWHVNLLAAPDWVRLVLLLCVVQLAYVVWMATFPDWATVWVAMLANALMATLYGAALAIFLYSPVDAPLGLGLGSVVRRTAIGWSLSVMMITTLMAFACGRVCAQWRRADEWKRKRMNHT